MASGTSGKPAGALDGFLEHHRIAASAFRRQGFGQFQVPLVNGGVSVGAQALLRERCNVGGKSFCCGSRLSIGHHPICKPHRLCFFRINRSTGQNHIHGVAVANNAWQAHGASIDQRYPPAAAEHAEGGGFLYDSQVTHQCQLQPPGHGVAGYGSDHRLRQ